ncbi:unnamed protein product, partial [Dibothriocephalus latus]
MPGGCASAVNTPPPRRRQRHAFGASHLRHFSSSAAVRLCCICCDQKSERQQRQRQLQLQQFPIKMSASFPVKREPWIERISHFFQQRTVGSSQSPLQDNENLRGSNPPPRLQNCRIWYLSNFPKNRALRQRSGSAPPNYRNHDFFDEDNGPEYDLEASEPRLQGSLPHTFDEAGSPRGSTCCMSLPMNSNRVSRNIQHPLSESASQLLEIAASLVTTIPNRETVSTVSDSAVFTDTDSTLANISSPDFITGRLSHPKIETSLTQQAQWESPIRRGAVQPHRKIWGSQGNSPQKRMASEPLRLQQTDVLTPTVEKDSITRGTNEQPTCDTHSIERDSSELPASASTSTALSISSQVNTSGNRPQSASKARSSDNCTAVYLSAEGSGQGVELSSCETVSESLSECEVTTQISNPNFPGSQTGASQRSSISVSTEPPRSPNFSSASDLRVDGDRPSSGQNGVTVSRSFKPEAPEELMFGFSTLPVPQNNALPDEKVTPSTACEVPFSSKTKSPTSANISSVIPSRFDAVQRPTCLRAPPSEGLTVTTKECEKACGQDTVQATTPHPHTGSSGAEGEIFNSDEVENKPSLVMKHNLATAYNKASGRLNLDIKGLVHKAGQYETSDGKKPQEETGLEDAPASKLEGPSTAKDL